MPIDIEISLVAVHAFADGVGHPTNGKNIAGAVKREGVVGIEALGGHHLGVDWGEPRVIGLKGMQVSHRLMIPQPFTEIPAGVASIATGWL